MCSSRPRRVQARFKGVRAAGKRKAKKAKKPESAGQYQNGIQSFFQAEMNVMMKKNVAITRPKLRFELCRISPAAFAFSRSLFIEPKLARLP